MHIHRSLIETCLFRFMIKTALTMCTRPYVNLALIAANVLVFLVFQDAGEFKAINASSISHGLIPVVLFDIRDLAPQFQVLPDWMSLITYAFLHGSFMHLIGNMLFLWVFGDNVEDAMGHVRYLVFYLICAVFRSGLCTSGPELGHTADRCLRRRFGCRGRLPDAASEGQGLGSCSSPGCRCA